MYVFSQVSNTPQSTIAWKTVCPMSLDKYSTTVFPLFGRYQHTLCNSTGRISQEP